ncbi:MAG TPA: pentapeptide repeat-containing protein [Thermoanaerobaculia bacterium]
MKGTRKKKDTASSAEPLLESYTKAEVGITDSEKSVEPRASLTPQRQPVRYAVVYDEADAVNAEKLLGLLRTQMKASARYAFEGWAPSDLKAGERHDKRQESEEASQVVIVFLSPALCGDDAAKTRLAALRDGGRLLVPVVLGSVDENRHDLGPCAGLELFRGPAGSFAGGGTAKKEAFAQSLWQTIETTIEGTPLPSSAAKQEGSLFDLQTKSLDLPRHIVATRAHLADIRLMGGERESATSQRDAVDAVPYLQAWAGDPAAPPFFALLGETGSGKTTTCRLLARRMLDARTTDSAAPMPIYLDLRRFSWDGKPGFTLDAILEAVLTKSFQRGTDPVPTPGDVIRHVQQHGAAALFDGLDEVIVHMSPKLAQDFIRELWRVLPLRKRDGSADTPGRPGKLLLSCRSHYFRRVWEQNTMLLGEEREGLRAQDYRALVLLPFTPEQVEEYLRHNVPGLDVERALELIGSVHNLTEMSARPFTLSLIGEFLPELEQKIASGAEIQGVDLYKAMVTRWLLRDEGKHRFNPTHKEVLMERLAAKLWASARREWKAEELEDWLDDVLASDQRLRDVYGAAEREVLKEDLRTATFLVRPDAESFRFAHTSLQEFFLARHLQRALREGAEKRWSLPIPSDETLEFLLQLVRGARDDREVSERTLVAILGNYQPLGSELALRFWLHARSRGDAFRTPPRFDLRGARLADWRFLGLSGRPLVLRDADFREADLRRTVFERVDLSGADLSGARMSFAECHEVTATEAVLDSVDLSGSLWRLSTLTGADLGTVALGGSRFIRCRFSGVSWPSSGPRPVFAGCRDDAGERSTLSAAANPRVDLFTGHGDGVRTCAVSPDGRWIVSGSNDNTLRVWDAANGENMWTLEGHGGVVMACAVSPDGRWIVSGSSDKTLRVWDVASRESVRTLEGHDDVITACAVSPDGRWIVSGSYDKTLRVWDAASGESMRTLQGHGDWVLACAVSPDGRWIVSGSDDQTLRVWDTASGESVRTLKGHGRGVTACAVSLDGRWIVSGSFDKTLCVWDVASGERVRTLEGHGGAVMAFAMSPDGRWIVSGSYDDTLRVWNAASGESVQTLDRHDIWIMACAVSPDGRRIVSGSYDKTLRVWDAASGDNVRTLEGHGDGVTVCAVSPDGRWIVSGSYDKTLRVWDAAGGESVRTLEGHGDGVIACAVSPDGRWIVSGSEDHTLRVWDAASGESVRTLQGHGGVVMACAVSPGGRWIVSGSYDKTLRVWDAASGESVRTLEGHGDWVRACAVSPDGRWAVSGSDDARLRVWDMASGESVRTLEGHGGGVRTCTVSRDGAWIVSGSYDKTLRVWDAASGESVRTLEGHRGAVVGCAVSSDGRRIISVSYDNTIRVWDATTGAPLLTIALFPDGSEAVFDESPRRIRRATPGAWRYLGWLAPDPVTGFLRRYPAESFGPLPGAE